MKVLLVEDDRELAQALKQTLNKHNYACELSHDGIDAEFIGNEEPFDAIVLDLGLPKRPGLEVLKNWRKQGNLTPVLILTSRDSWHERVDGLKAGADDYLGKPFHTEELLARLDAIIRRHHGHAHDQFNHANLHLNSDSQQLQINNQPAQTLTGIEYRLIRLLLMNPERILSKTEIGEHIYEEEMLRDSNVLEVYVNRLRKRFGKDLIKTHRGQGYSLGRGG